MSHTIRNLPPSMLLRCAAALLAVVTVPPLTAQSPANVPCDSIQYRVVDLGAPRGTRRYPNHRTGESFALKDSILLDARDIDHIETRAQRRGGDTLWSVIATLTPAAARTFGVTTASHIGETIAVRLGNEVVATGTIETRLGAKVPIATDVSKATADSLSARSSRAMSASCRSAQD